MIKNEDVIQAKSIRLMKGIQFFFSFFFLGTFANVAFETWEALYFSFI